MTHAYDSLYLSKASRTIGNMLHDAIYAFGIDGDTFMKLFIQSSIAQQIEDGNPKYLAGKSGLELYLEVIERTTGQTPDVALIESYDRSNAYWVGWMLTHYQWYSGRSFEHILSVVPYRELIGLYETLHEADIQKSYEVLDALFSNSGSQLKKMRKRVGLTQEELAAAADVSVNSIRAYERGSKDLSKAQFQTVLNLVAVLKCDVSDLLN